MSEPLIFFLAGLVVALVVVGLRRRFGSFHGQTLEDYSDGYPEFDLKKHLNGRMICEGVIYGPLGRVTSSFVARFDITWDDDVGQMREEFVYNDGSTQSRHWTITIEENGTFSATAPDVPGKGQGAQAGPAMRMVYPIQLPQSLGGHILQTVDWMYLTPEGTILNRSQFRKYGVKVAELVATIRTESTI
ncbi:MAG: hypothetical protein CML55_07740 [Rhodobacteraceae bacterium]|nr:hypothetical protein [Paracoccaceae bacterium]MBO27404.1 hypothetical protein [Paracoccaceae bacterium]|tara:strand:- start:31 stop:597 length:567 start_codon:yes stop_codon:yes gene_type:complete